MSSLARLVETTLTLTDVAASEATEAIDLNGADKFSIEVTATTGDSIAHLEVSNTSAASSDDADWTEIDDESIAEGESAMFEQPNSPFRWARVVIENDDAVEVSADCLVLVTGDAV